MACLKNSSTRYIFNEIFIQVEPYIQLVRLSMQCDSIINSFFLHFLSLFQPISCLPSFSLLPSVSSNIYSLSSLFSIFFAISAWNTQSQYALYIERMVYSFKRIHKKETPWSESASELYRPFDRRLSAK
jgi:hypothetical protein